MTNGPIETHRKEPSEDEKKFLGYFIHLHTDK